MYNRILLVVALCIYHSISVAQDTVQVNCAERIVILPSSSQSLFRITGECDSVYLLSKPYYQSILTSVNNYKKFVAIYDKYRETSKAADADMTNIINSYDQIIKSKDEAFSTLYTEYSKMNKLLDKSVNQSKKAVNIGETTLKEVKDINVKLQNENLKLNESLQHLKDIAQREKLNAGLTGGIIGGGVALIVGGVIGGILGYNIHR